MRNAFMIGLIGLASLLGPWVSAQDVKQGDQYAMNLVVHPMLQSMKGTLKLDHVNQGAQPLDEIALRLDMNLRKGFELEIKRVGLAGADKASWAYEKGTYGTNESDHAQMRVKLPAPLAPGETARLEIEFTGKGGFLGGDPITLQDDPYHSMDGWYPKAMSWDGQGWSVNDNRLAQYDVTVDLPAKYVVASTGALQEEPATEGGRTVHRLRAEATRGFTIYASADWEKHTREVNGVRLEVCLPGKATSYAPALLDTMADTIGFYGETYGPFPVRQLSLVCPGDFSQPAHGSSAACGMILVWLSRDFDAQYRWLIAHEVAHQYWGTSIGLERGEIAWAAIGLGMQMDRAYMRARNLEYDRFKTSMDWFFLEAVRRNFNTSLSQPLDPILKSAPPWNSGWNMSLMHGKANFVCNMLRDLMGDAAFDGVIRKLIAEQAGGVMANARFVEACRAASAVPLDEFVADWIDGMKALDYAVSEVRKADGGWEVAVEQRGEAAYPVWVEAEFADGAKLRQRADRGSRIAVLNFAGDGELQRVTIDPDGICPDMERGNDVWVRNE